MSFFGVTKEIIETISPIEGADFIQQATLKNLTFVFVIGKDSFKVGDEVLYFPVDSIIPEPTLIKLGLVGKLAGKNKDRVKTKKLKNIFSQGVVGPLSLLNGMPDVDLTSENITKFLGVVKYEPPAIMEKGANLLPLPAYLSVYDIEGCDRYTNVVDYLLDKKVNVGEKVEGMNFSVSYDRQNDKLFVNQRRYTIENIDGHVHTFWKLAEDFKLTSYIKEIAKEYDQDIVTIYAEAIGPGIQGNIYKLNNHEVQIFDIKFTKFYTDYKIFKNIVSKYNIKTVPIIAEDVTLREWLNGKTVKEASNGESKLFKTLREGIVIKPMVEEYSNDLQGRLIIKQRDPVYLDKHDT